VAEGAQTSFSFASVVFRYLTSFVNPAEETKRARGQAFIPAAMSVCKLSGNQSRLAALCATEVAADGGLPWKWMPASWKPLSKTLCLAIKAARPFSHCQSAGPNWIWWPIRSFGRECTGGLSEFAGVSGDPGGITERDTESLLEE